MTPQQLKALIDSDAEATQLANAGNDAACAARLTAIAPKVTVFCQLTDRGLYQRLGPVVAETILQKLEGYAAAQQQYSLIIKRFLKWLEPANEGVDFADPLLLMLCDGLTAGGLLTEAENTAIKSLSLRDQVITPEQVTEAMAPYRN